MLCPAQARLARDVAYFAITREMGPHSSAQSCLWRMLAMFTGRSSATPLPNHHDLLFVGRNFAKVS